VGDHEILRPLRQVQELAAHDDLAADVRRLGVMMLAILQPVAQLLHESAQPPARMQVLELRLGQGLLELGFRRAHRRGLQVRRAEVLPAGVLAQPPALQALAEVGVRPAGLGVDHHDGQRRLKP
jgi:hypothetical protein